MRKLGPTVLLASLLAAYGQLALAREPGGGHFGGMPHSTHAEANSNSQFSADRENGPARAKERISKQGLLNTNGPNASDRDKGLERAEDRRSAQGAAHEKATAHPSGKKHAHEHKKR